jgi:arylsulfatase A-like enzyme
VPPPSIACVALAALALGARAESAPQDGRLRLPILRFLDAMPPALPDGLAWGRHVRIGDEERLALTSLETNGHPAPPLAARDVVSRWFDVPADARLDFAIGVELPPRVAPPTAVEFRVIAEDGARETVVDQRVYDPRDVSQDRVWRDASVDLSALAGRTIRLRLSTRAADGASAGSALPVWGDPVVSAPRASGALNVVLVSLDTLRAKSVGAYGSRRPTTPALDELVGAAGTIFEAAYTTVPHTLPAHLGMFTGRYLRNLGGVNPLRALGPDIPTLPERMRAAGYATAAFTEDGYIVPRLGFRRGFAQFRENTSPDMTMPLGHSARTFRAGVDWLARHRDRPAFLFLHTYEVHEPYTPPPPYDTVFAPGGGPETVPVAELLRYEQEARYLDDELRALVESIDALGLGTRTLLVVTADHGEEFMEHGQTRHCWHLFEESIHVPFMMRLPGVVPAGLRIDTPVSLVDVAPTILDLVGAPPMEGTDGVSLVPLLLGARLPDWRLAVFSEARSSLSAPSVDLVSARLGNTRCTLQMRRGTAFCYDLTRDPEEAVPLGTHDSRAAAARAAASTYVDLLTSGPRSDSELAAPDPTSDSDRAEKLRALGYVQ